MTILEKLFSLNLYLGGLMLDMRRPSDSDDGYDCMPIGALPFASMGVDGVHYCIVPKENDETLENSPIYRISPMDFSNGTVLWTAKNFYDLISIAVMLKDAWCLPSMIYERYPNFLKESEREYDIKDEEEKREIKRDIAVLKKEFPIIKIDDLYSYVINSYIDTKNHAELRFSDDSIKELELGHYAYVY